MSIAKSARSRVLAERVVRAAVAEVAAQDSEPSLFQAKARNARRPTRDANPRNPAGNIVYSPFLAPRISWQPPTRCMNPFHAACSSLFLVTALRSCLLMRSRATPKTGRIPDKSNTQKALSAMCRTFQPAPVQAKPGDSHCPTQHKRSAIAQRRAKCGG